MPEKRPNFIGLGVAKAGTTSLYHYLQQHPEVYLSPIKETNYFISDFIQSHQLRKDLLRSTKVDMQAYLAAPTLAPFHSASTVLTQEHYLALFREVNEQKAIGEVCTSYFLVPSSLDKIKAEFPDVKLFAILRNPIERAFSGYVMNLREGKTDQENQLLAFKNDYERPDKGWGINFNYIDGGLYAPTLQKLYELFPAKNIKIFLYDDYKKNSSEVIRSLYTFLNVDPDFKADTSQNYNVGGLPRFKKLNQWMVKTGLREMIRRLFPQSVKNQLLKIMYSSKHQLSLQDDARKYLKEVFKDDIKATGQILNRDLSPWIH